jgi:hypothetical protein
MDNNGWPGKPGVPLNPERDGAHWLKGYTEDACMWQDEGWYIPGYSHKLDDETVASRYSYLGPALTPAEVDARVKEARRDAMEEAARRLEELHRQHKYNPETGEGSEHDTGYYRALVEGAGWIRALSDTPSGMVLVPREPTSAMIQAGFLVEPQAFKHRIADWWPSDVTAIYSAMVKAAGKGECDE